jgi:hypothetical protein
MEGCTYRTSRWCCASGLLVHAPGFSGESCVAQAHAAVDAVERVLFKQSNSSMVASSEFSFHFQHSLARPTGRSCLYQVYRLPEAHCVPRIGKRSGDHVILTLRYVRGESERSSPFYPCCEWREAIRIEGRTDTFRLGIVGYLQKREMERSR